MNELHLFAGCGGGILGGVLLGHTTVCAVEIEPYCQKVLLQRQRDGILPRFPIWDDVTTFDGTPWRGKVDVVCGGFPCTDISRAGAGEGIDGDESGLWTEMARIISEVRPRYIFVENSAMLIVRGLDRILADISAMGYDIRWGIIGASFCGYDHQRNRLWIVADSNSNGLEGRDYLETKRQWQAKIRSVAGLCKTQIRDDIPAPNAFGIANGIPSRMDRLKAIGNGQVPAVAAIAFRTLSD